VFVQYTHFLTITHDFVTKYAITCKDLIIIYVSTCTLDDFVLIRHQNAPLVCRYNTLKNVRFGFYHGVVEALALLK
jgi:hypothetical protein